jgi:hypothetical protein
MEGSKMKKILLISFLCGSLLIFAACASSGGGSAAYNSVGEARAPAMADYSEEYEYYGADDSEGYYVASELASTSGLARKVVTNAEFRVKTDDFDGAMRRLEHKIAVSGSYIQQSNNYSATDYRGASASMTIRVPSSMYGDFKKFITELDELVYASESGEDVTAQYYDTEARLKVLQAQAERVRTFIGSAKNLEEIFTIERELTRINTEIEQLTTVKNRLDNLVAYSTVYVDIFDGNEAKIEPVGFSERLSEALSGSLSGIVVAAQSFLILLIWCWPAILLGAVGFTLWRKYVKMRSRREQIKSDQ